MADHADDGGDNDGVFIYMGGLIPEHLRETITHVRIHKSVKIISARAFLECIHLVSIELHDGVEIIEDHAFQCCHSLKGIKLPGVRVIEQGAFFCCKALADVEFGDKLETIGQHAFAGNALRNVKIPKVRVIGDGAFCYCKQLTDLELPEDLERIEEGAISFAGHCPRLRRIAMPLKDNLLGDGVFNNCDNLSQVELVGWIHKTVSSLLLESWRDDMSEEIDLINQALPHPPHIQKTTVIQEWMRRVLEKIEHYKSEHYALLKELTTLLELALWKANLDDNVGDIVAAREGVRVTRGQIKRARKDRSITSGADIVIKNVLPFLKLE